jgi:hypothetical protein
MDLLEQVTALRAEGLSQAEIAAKVGKSQTRVSQLLRGTDGNDSRRRRKASSLSSSQQSDPTTDMEDGGEPFDVADLNAMVADLVAGLVTQDECEHCLDAHGLPLCAGNREFRLCALCLLKLRQARPGLKVTLRPGAGPEVVS